MDQTGNEDVVPDEIEGEDVVRDEQGQDLIPLKVQDTDPPGFRLLDLPIEIFDHVVGFTSVFDVVAMRRVNRDLNTYLPAPDDAPLENQTARVNRETTPVRCSQCHYFIRKQLCRPCSRPHGAGIHRPDVYLCASCVWTIQQKIRVFRATLMMAYCKKCAAQERAGPAHHRNPCRCGTDPPYDRVVTQDIREWQCYPCRLHTLRVDTQSALQWCRDFVPKENCRRPGLTHETILAKRLPEAAHEPVSDRDWLPRWIGGHYAADRNHCPGPGCKKNFKQICVSYGLPIGGPMWWRCLICKNMRLQRPDPTTLGNVQGQMTTEPDSEDEDRDGGEELGSDDDINYFDDSLIAPYIFEFNEDAPDDDDDYYHRFFSLPPQMDNNLDPALYPDPVPAPSTNDGPSFISAWRIHLSAGADTNDNGHENGHEDGYLADVDDGISVNYSDMTQDDDVEDDVEPENV